MTPGRLLPYWGVKGGVGTSTLACLSGRIHRSLHPSLRIGLLDLLPPASSPLPSHLGVTETPHTLTQLAAYPGERSAALMETYFSRSPEGLFYVPVGPESGSSPSVVPHLEGLLDWLELLLVDLSGADPATRNAVMERAHRLILVADRDAASLSALVSAEKRFLAAHHDLRTCRVWMNLSRGGSLPGPVASWVPEGLDALAPTSYAGQDLSLRLMGSREVPQDIVRIFGPTVAQALDVPRSVRIPTVPESTRAPHAPSPAGPAVDPQQVQRLHRDLLERLREEGFPCDPGTPDRTSLEPRAKEILDRLIQAWDLPDRDFRRRLEEQVLDLAFGLGPLHPLLSDGDVTEIMVNGPGQVFVEKEGRLERHGARFLDEQQLRTVIERILAPLGRRIDESQPYVDGRLPDGSRVNAVIPPVSLDGPLLTIRKFREQAWTPEDLVRRGALTREATDLLGACVKARKNIVVSGGTGSGKTTLLNVLSGFIPPQERIVTIEDSAELRLRQEHVVRLEARPANLEGRGRIAIRDLVINALRMRPDRIVVGEVRGGEALDMLQAMNTGHDGSMTTAHANTPRDALSRLETMCLMAGLDLPLRAVREQVARAVHLVVQQSRLPGGGRGVTRITEVQGMDGDVILMQDLFVREEPRGLVRKPFHPSFLEDLKPFGYRPVPIESPLD